MKKLLYIASLLCLVSCNSEKGWNCIKNTGNIVTEERAVTSFSEIVVEDDLFLEIEQGDTHQVFVTTGENLQGDISVDIEGDVLRLKNNNSCNFNREFDVSTVRVITPTLTKVRSSSINVVSSIGELEFPSLLLKSDTSPGVIDEGKSGDFIINVNNEELLLSANGQSEFIVSGSTDLLRASMLDEIPKVSAANLMAKKVTFFTRSANTITVYPVEELSGTIGGVGDVIAKNKPPIVDVETFFTGRLIFE